MRAHELPVLLADHGGIIGSSGARGDTRDHTAKTAHDTASARSTAWLHLTCMRCGQLASPSGSSSWRPLSSACSAHSDAPLVHAMPAATDSTSQMSARRLLISRRFAAAERAAGSSGALAGGPHAPG